MLTFCSKTKQNNFRSAGVRPLSEGSDMSTNSSVDRTVPRSANQNQGGVLKDSVLRQKKTGS